MIEVARLRPHTVEVLPAFCVTYGFPTPSITRVGASRFLLSSNRVSVRSTSRAGSFKLELTLSVERLTGVTHLTRPFAPGFAEMQCMACASPYQSSMRAALRSIA
jgi:hypothetical protein